MDENKNIRQPLEEWVATLLNELSPNLFPVGYITEGWTLSELTNFCRHMGGDGPDSKYFREELPISEQTSSILENVDLNSNTERKSIVKLREERLVKEDAPVGISGFGSIKGIKARLDELSARIATFRKLLETDGRKIDYSRASPNFLESYREG